MYSVSDHLVRCGGNFNAGIVLDAVNTECDECQSLYDGNKLLRAPRWSKQE